MTTRTRRGGRSARRKLRQNRVESMLPQLRRNMPYVEPLSQEQITTIHDASMDILEDVGVDFRDPIALTQLKEAGCQVDGERVRFDRHHVMELVSSIPSDITLIARNPQHSVNLGGGNAIFVPMTGAPFIRDLSGERRWGSLQDLNTFHKLAHMSPAIHSSAHVICEPMDVPVGHRHLWITYSSMSHSDKTYMGMSTSGENAADVMEMTKILFGEDFVMQHPVVTANVNGNSPLVWDETMLGALRVFASHNQPVLCSPFVLGGANTPASTVPAVVQLNAEALSALAYTQVVKKGAPAIYGHYLSTVSMASGAPMAGTPEISLMNFMIGQLARYYDIPWRTSNTLGGAKTFDAQAGYESATTLMAVVLAGANYIWHSAGWNEGGMHCCMSKFVVDAEQCAMAYRMTEGPRWDDFDEALAAVRDVGPGGHYMGHKHTQDNFQRGFFMPKLFDNNSIEQWEQDGSKEITERSAEYAESLINQYEKPDLDPAINEQLLDYIARREHELPGDVH
ncbi:MAG: trimethylamine methyltransferase family protein [Pseudomonadota bacterium]